MSAATNYHAHSGEETRTTAEFDHADVGDTAWFTLGFGEPGRATDTATFFLSYIDKAGVDTFIKQQRKALRDMSKWNEAR